MGIEIQIEEPFQNQVRENWLRNAAEATVVSEGIDYPIELSLLITDNETIHKLNCTYRKVDQPTDVLAFAFQEVMDVVSFPSPPDGVTHLGEVIISCPQAAMQASKQGHLLKDELTILVIHGVLHLLGYNHENPAEKQVMRIKEAEILTRQS